MHENVRNVKTHNLPEIGTNKIETKWISDATCWTYQNSGTPLTLFTKGYKYNQPLRARLHLYSKPGKAKDQTGLVVGNSFS